MNHYSEKMTIYSSNMFVNKKTETPFKPWRSFFFRDSGNSNVPGSRPDLGQIWLHRLNKTTGVAGLRQGFCDWGAAKDGPKPGCVMVFWYFPSPLVLSPEYSFIFRRLASCSTIHSNWPASCSRSLPKSSDSKNSKTLSKLLKYETWMFDQKSSSKSHLCCKEMCFLGTGFWEDESDGGCLAGITGIVSAWP